MTDTKFAEKITPILQIAVKEQRIIVNSTIEEMNRHAQLTHQLMERKLRDMFAQVESSFQRMCKRLPRAKYSPNCIDFGEYELNRAELQDILHTVFMNVKFSAKDDVKELRSRVFKALMEFGENLDEAIRYAGITKCKQIHKIKTIFKAEVYRLKVNRSLIQRASVGEILDGISRISVERSHDKEEEFYEELHRLQRADEQSDDTLTAHDDSEERNNLSDDNNEKYVANHKYTLDTQNGSNKSSHDTEGHDQNKIMTENTNRHLETVMHINYQRNYTESEDSEPENIGALKGNPSVNENSTRDVSCTEGKEVMNIKFEQNNFESKPSNQRKIGGSAKNTSDIQNKSRYSCDTAGKDLDNFVTQHTKQLNGTKMYQENAMNIHFHEDTENANKGDWNTDKGKDNEDCVIAADEEHSENHEHTESKEPRNMAHSNTTQLNLPESNTEHQTGTKKKCKQPMDFTEKSKQHGTFCERKIYQCFSECHLRDSSQNFNDDRLHNTITNGAHQPHQERVSKTINQFCTKKKNDEVLQESSNDVNINDRAPRKVLENVPECQATEDGITVDDNDDDEDDSYNVLSNYEKIDINCIKRYRKYYKNKYRFKKSTITKDADKASSDTWRDTSNVNLYRMTDENNGDTLMAHYKPEKPNTVEQEPELVLSDDSDSPGSSSEGSDVTLYPQTYINDTDYVVNKLRINIQKCHEEIKEIIEEFLKEVPFIPEFCLMYIHSCIKKVVDSSNMNVEGTIRFVRSMLDVNESEKIDVKFSELSSVITKCIGASEQKMKAALIGLETCKDIHTFGHVRALEQRAGINPPSLTSDDLEINIIALTVNSMKHFLSVIETRVEDVLREAKETLDNRGLSQFDRTFPLETLENEQEVYDIRETVSSMIFDVKAKLMQCSLYLESEILSLIGVTKAIVTEIKHETKTAMKNMEDVIRINMQSIVKNDLDEGVEEKITEVREEENARRMENSDREVKRNGAIKKVTFNVSNNETNESGAEVFTLSGIVSTYWEVMKSFKIQHNFNDIIN